MTTFWSLRVGRNMWWLLFVSQTENLTTFLPLSFDAVTHDTACNYRSAPFFITSSFFTRLNTDGTRFVPRLTACCFYSCTHVCCYIWLNLQPIYIIFLTDVRVSTSIRFNNAIGDLKLHIISLNAIRKTGKYVHQPHNIKLFTFYPRRELIFLNEYIDKTALFPLKQKNIFNSVHLPRNWER